MVVEPGVGWELEITETSQEARDYEDDKKYMQGGM